MVPAPQSRKMHSVFFTIFFSLLLVLVIELTLLIGTIVVGQVPSQLDDNAEEVLCEQVENRSGYLQNFLVSSQELTALSTYINSQTEALLADGTISLDTLDSGSAASEPLLRAISSELVFEMRAKNSAASMLFSAAAIWMTAWTGRASPVFMCATSTRMVHIPTAMLTFRWSLPRQRLCNPQGFTPPALGSLPLNISAKHQTFSIFPIKPRGTLTPCFRRMIMVTGRAFHSASLMTRAACFPTPSR